IALANLSHRAPEMLSSSTSAAREANTQAKALEIDKTSMSEPPRNRDADNRQAERSTPTEPFRAPTPNSSAPTGESTLKPENSSTAALIDLTKPNEARRVQQRLNELGYLEDAADGKWGQRSRRALQDFRTAMAIGVDSTWDQQTQQ